MKPTNANFEIFVPDRTPVQSALKRITHLGIGAHQDDLEFMAFQGIVECYDTDRNWFGGVTCTNGGGSARSGEFKDLSDEQLVILRKQEQNQAAAIGKYGVMIHLDYPSRTIKNPLNTELRLSLQEILRSIPPGIIYAHNPADKHETHVAVAMATLQAVRELPPAQRPQRVIGCEVWRDLDWLPDEDKVVMDVSGHDVLSARLSGVFKSQIAGGKRYDIAIHGRRAANATFFDSHAVDGATQVAFGIDLTPLITDIHLDIAEFMCQSIDRFKSDVRKKISKYLI